ncbi:MAG: hypothetical protein M3N91_16885 [Pseudomonadota bacterium]|nr:hypothetical protein [Pseudomonadota bacterium]
MTRTIYLTVTKKLIITVAAALAMFSLASSADTQSPFVGTWVLKVEKSTFDPPQPPKSQTVTVTEAPGGGSHIAIDYVYADGSGSHMEYTTLLDGKAVPVTGSPYVDSMIATQVTPRTIKDVYMKDGKPVSTGTVTVSKNGKTMQGPFSGTNANGVWKDRYIFVRQ